LILLKIFFAAIVAVMASICSAAGLLYTFFPSIISEFYSQVPIQGGYRFNQEESNGNKRQDIEVILYPGIDQQELLDLLRGLNTQTTTMDTADKNGYKGLNEVKNRTLAGSTLKAATG
ncbi:hypothetical protein KR067_009165, partial [Drosophila pandora]